LGFDARDSPGAIAMSDHDRGAYTPPTEGPLAFEARQPVRGARPFPLTLVVSVLVLLGLAAAIFVFYRQGVRQAGPPQAVGAPVGGLKAPAPADAQPQDAAAGLEIYRSESGQPPQMVPAQPQFTPAPEQPQARPQPGPPVVITPAPAAPAPTAKPLPPAQAAPALRPSQSAPPPAAVEKPAAQAPTRPAAAERVAEKPKAKPPAEKPAPAAKAGAAAVQIGAVSSPALADQTWNEAVAVSPGLAAGKGKGVEKVDKDGKTLYRTSVTGFASKADAQAFCAKLKAAGKACFVK
jgi:hypothetical protein